MVFLAVSFDGLQVGVFIFVCFVLAGTIWLYRTSMESMRKLQEEQRQQYSHLLTSLEIEKQQSTPNHRPTSGVRNTLIRLFNKRPQAHDVPDNAASLTPVDLLAVKQMLEQQQQLSQQLLSQIDHLQAPSVVENRQATKAIQRRTEELELLVEQKEEEIQQLQTQQKMTDKLSYKLEQVQEDFYALQERMRLLEQQAAQAGRLNIELEDNKAAYEQVSSELSRKSEKIQQVVLENAQLREQLAETEDKLQEANLQRQQLFKKVRLLEDMNNELQAVSDTNKKLQAELRRIGELESMLNMILEERKELQRK